MNDHDESANPFVRTSTPGRRSRLAAGLCLGVLTMPFPPARAASLVPTGKPAPELSLTTIDGKTVRLADLEGQVVLLIFGEFYNRNSVAACQDLAKILAVPAMAEIKTATFLVVTQKSPDAELLDQAKKAKITLPIVHDPSRRIFAQYRVMVLPSLLVIDPEGTVVLPCAGYPLDFRDMVTDAILYAGGKLTAKEFARKRSAPTTRPASVAHVRAVRLAALGTQLAQRGSLELAVNHFRDALALDSDCIPARLGLGTVLLNRRELAEAEKHFLHVLGTAPNSVEASLGLIHIQVIRGGDELKLATTRLHELERKRPTDPKVVYLAGLVAEKTGNIDDALGHYRRAAELLLYGQKRRMEFK